ncbi:MAG: alpha/beta fold hydrolase [Polymorphobacter sp.]|uniref:alpha/beta fold hydrolase n=1 Tax=Polymorphobacter sp. TaxID=1909290 RepID=UPI003A8C2600
MARPLSPEHHRRRRTLPEAGHLEQLTLRDGWRLRAMSWPAGPKGMILFINGRGDFIEKYAETYHDWLDAGFGVATFDWRGQGGSGRLGRTPGHGHVEDMTQLVDDLGEVFSWAMRLAGGPCFAVAHSMGGHLLLRHLAAAPETARRAVLLSPMIGISAPPFGPWLAARLARAMVALGRGQQWVFGAGPYGTGGSARQALLTTDAGRYADERWWVAQHPELALGGITWGWLKAAFASMAKARPVPVSTLVLMAESEALVDNAATRRMFPEARMVQGAAHELLRERPAIRRQVLAMIEAFLVDDASL